MPVSSSRLEVLGGVGHVLFTSIFSWCLDYSTLFYIVNLCLISFFGVQFTFSTIQVISV